MVRAGLITAFVLMAALPRAVAAETPPPPLVAGGAPGAAPSTGTPEKPLAAAGKEGSARSDVAAEHAGAAKQLAETQKDTAASKKKAEEDTRAVAALNQGSFRSTSLAGGTDNEFRVQQPANRLTNVKVTLKWVKSPQEPTHLFCSKDQSSPPDYAPSTKAADTKDATKTVFAIHVPSPPCLWPLTQYATIAVSARMEKDGKIDVVPLLEEAPVPVTVLWFPLFVTFAVLALIYPGGAAASWYASKRQYQKKAAKAVSDGLPFDEKEPEFWRSLDPVELTKNPWGRGSIAKLQIFTFSFIIFGLLLFNVLRTGLLANMSTDILYLMGISAVGSAGGKIAYVARRRLSMENWVWLRLKQWLPDDKDVQPHAKWSELFVDSGTKEFDPYRFQMAVFSLVVALALVTTSATGLEAFKVPPEMLGLLGISQVVFIGGQAMENGGYADLDKKLTEVRAAEKAFQAFKLKADSAADAQSKTDAQQKAGAEYTKFKTGVAQAKEMFFAVYGQELGPNLPPALENADRLEPEVHT